MREIEVCDFCDQVDYTTKSDTGSDICYECKRIFFPASPLSLLGPTGSREWAECNVCRQPIDNEKPWIGCMCDMLAREPAYRLSAFVWK